MVVNIFYAFRRTRMAVKNVTAYSSRGRLIDGTAAVAAAAAGQGHDVADVVIGATDQREHAQREQQDVLDVPDSFADDAIAADRRRRRLLFAGARRLGRAADAVPLRYRRAVVTIFLPVVAVVVLRTPIPHGLRDHGQYQTEHREPDGAHQRHERPDVRHGRGHKYCEQTRRRTVSGRVFACADRSRDGTRTPSRDMADRDVAKNPF